MKTDVLERMNIACTVWRGRLCLLVLDILDLMKDIRSECQYMFSNLVPTVEIQRGRCRMLIIRWPNPDWTVVHKYSLPDNGIQCFCMKRDTPGIGQPGHRDIACAVRLGDSPKKYFLHLEEAPGTFYDDVDVLREALDWLAKNPHQWDVPPSND